MISRDMLLEVARRKGLTNRNFIEKDYLQDLFLYHLFRKTNLLIFKGGTCLYKLYGLPRFSEDLDFSVLGGSLDTNDLIAATAGRLGADVLNVKSTKHSQLIKIGFEGPFTAKNTLRVDINLQNSVFEFDVKQYLSSYVDVHPFSLRVLSPKEIIAEKVHSLLARNKARDLYDLFFLLRFVTPDPKVIEEKLAIFDMHYTAEAFQEKIAELKGQWTAELRPFVFTELTEYEVAKNYVLEKMPGNQKNNHPSTTTTR